MSDVADLDGESVSGPFKAVSEKEIANRLDHYLDETLVHPIGIQRRGETQVVMISYDEYERLLERDRLRRPAGS